MNNKKNLLGEHRHRFYTGYNFTYPAHFKHLDDLTDIYFIHHAEHFEQNLQHLFYKPNICLEIGVFAGGASVWFLEKICNVPDSHLYMMDVRDINTYDILKNNLKPYNNWTYMVGDSSESFKTFNHQGQTEEFCDFIYVDGDHSTTGTYKDAVNAFRCLKSGGIICFDDYRPYDETEAGHSVKIAVDAFESRFKNQIEFRFESFQKWFVKK